MKDSNGSDAALFDYHYYNDDIVCALVQSLSDTQILWLHARLKKLDVGEWLDWLQAHLEESEARLADCYRVSVTGSAPDAALVTYGAIYLAQLAGQMLPYFDVTVQGKHSNPETRAARGSLLQRAGGLLPELWPFDQPPLDNPFFD